MCGSSTSRLCYFNPLIEALCQKSSVRVSLGLYPPRIPYKDMVNEVYPSAFLYAFKGGLLTSKSVKLSTQNAYMFKVDRHLDKVLIKAILEFILETPIDKIQTRSSRKKIRVPGRLIKVSNYNQFKKVQVTLVNKASLKDWISY